jgi:homoserine O-acetyltransferase/O-succinyltransferase
MRSSLLWYGGVGLKSDDFYSGGAAGISRSRVRYNSPAMKKALLRSTIQLFVFILVVPFVLLAQGRDSAQAKDGELQFANLGAFKLANGQIILDCRIGYRTFGHLNPEKSNAILFPTWASGVSEQLMGQAAPGKLADPTKYFVILVDALANGVSSSPSNSLLQPRMQFPMITLRDMVNSQHELLSQLGIHHLKAVMGISMGGMQTFQWLVSYPDFMDKAIPIVGSPRLAPYDLVLWQMEIDAIKSDATWNKGDYKENPAKRLFAEFWVLMGETPQRRNQELTRERVAEFLDQETQKQAMDANDHIRQMEAMISLDVSDRFGGSMERTAAAVKAKVLVVIATYDHVVTPGPAREFAKLLGTDLLELNSDCGHQTPGCEEAAILERVIPFLQK